MSRTFAFGLGGAFVGAVLGFLLRPSVGFLGMNLGKVPLGAVLTRGATLTGMNQALVPYAQESFNYVLIGALVGIMGGILIALLLKRSASLSAE